MAIKPPKRLPRGALNPPDMPQLRPNPEQTHTREEIVEMLDEAVRNTQSGTKDAAKGTVRAVTPTTFRPTAFTDQVVTARTGSTIETSRSQSLNSIVERYADMVADTLDQMNLTEEDWTALDVAAGIGGPPLRAALRLTLFRRQLGFLPVEIREIAKVAEAQNHPRADQLTQLAVYASEWTLTTQVAIADEMERRVLTHIDGGDRRTEMWPGEFGENQ